MIGSVCATARWAFDQIDASAAGRFVSLRAQSFTALNNVVADFGYLLYACFLVVAWLR
jgi:hypothetical protein